MTRNVALYTRVSTLDQDCSRQVRDLEAWAARMGWNIVARYTEKASGAKANREERLRIMRARGAFDAILVTEPSRWSRSLVDLVSTLDAMAAQGVSLLCLNGLTMDVSTPTGRLIVGVMGSIAEFERDLMRERIRSGIANARAQGRSTGGRAKGDAPEQKRIAADVKRMRDAGMKWRPIATALGCSHNTARKAYSLS
jgi:DNA invertase Pin-like site-specific DNA recombinase